MTILTTPTRDDEGCTWLPTGELRWIEFIDGEKKLQQLYKNINKRGTRWVDVPTESDF